jgi:low affinity Fe/Cu permease
MDTFRRALTQLGVLAAHPLAFVAVATYGVLWFIFDRQNLGWHGLAVLATWCMTLLIQRAEHRDTQAIHAKLDELLQAQARARRELVHIDDEEPEDIERLRARTGDDRTAPEGDGQAQEPRDFEERTERKPGANMN